jgi:hypothetical protein
VTFATADIPQGTPLLSYHAYTIEKITEAAFGSGTITLRNPWGMDGAGSDGKDDGLVTITAEQALGAMSGLVVANV